MVLFTKIGVKLKMGLETGNDPWEERMDRGGSIRNHPEICSSWSSSVSGYSGNTIGKESCPPVLLDEVNDAEEERKVDLRARIIWVSVF